MTSDQDKLIAILTAPPEASPDDGYLTFREISKACGYGENHLRDLLRDLNDAGRLECRRVIRRTIAGDYQAVPAYKLADTPVKST